MTIPIKEHLGTSVLFHVSPIELPDTVEHLLLFRYFNLTKNWNGKNLKDLSSEVLWRANSSQDEYVKVIHGLLFGILFFQLACSCVKDNWTIVVEQLKYFTFSKFLSLRHEVRVQLFWLVDKLISLNVPGCDGLVLGLLRQTKGGDRSQETIDHLLNVFSLLCNHLSWISQCGPMVPYVLYFSLRVLAEDHLPEHSFTSAVEICTHLLYQKYRECSMLGRELVRCLVEVARIPQIQHIWDWLLRPKDNGKSPFALLLAAPTPKRYLAMRLTPKAETDIQFLLEKSLSSQQGFYISLFIHNHVPSAPGDDGGALISDILRYIVGAIHPANIVLSSPVLQRWMLISAMLRSVRTSYAATSAKLSLFLDWIMFNPKVDNIMSVEPGLLVLAKSAFDHPNITSTLVEFLDLLTSKFYPPLSSAMYQGIASIFDLGMHHGVLSSKDQLLTPMLHSEIKEMLSSLMRPQKPTVSLNNANSVLLAAIRGDINISKAVEATRHTYDEQQLSQLFRTIVSTDLLKDGNVTGRLFELLVKLNCATLLISDVAKATLLDHDLSYSVQSWENLLKAEKATILAVSDSLVQWILRDEALDYLFVSRALSLFIFTISRLDSETASQVVSSLSCLMKKLPPNLALLFLQGLKSSLHCAHHASNVTSWFDSWDLSESIRSMSEIKLN